MGREDNFKSEWNAAQVYVKTLMMDYWLIKKSLYENNVDEALDWLVQYFDDLSPVMGEEELETASNNIKQAKESITNAETLTTREKYFGKVTGEGGDEIRQAMRFLLRVQRRKGLLIPGRSETTHWDPEEFMRKSDL